jgi:hypothetical protein
MSGVNLLKRAKLGRPTVYNWDEIIEKSLKGEEYDYVHGENFSCTPQSFAALVRHTARTRGLKAVVSVMDDHVYFAFIERN